MLGFRAVHFPSDPATRQEMRAFRRADSASGGLALTVLNGVDALTDIPVCPFYPALDRAYPNSKFVLTVRDKESWLASCEAHFRAREADRQAGSAEADYWRFVDEMRTWVYGVRSFDRRRFAAAYDAHQAAVTRYFQGRPDDLLVLNITNGEGWKELCAFLGRKRTPGVPFPWTNRRRGVSANAAARSARPARRRSAGAGRRKKIVYLTLAPLGYYVNGRDLTAATLLKRLLGDQHDVSAGVLLNEPSVPVYNAFLRRLTREPAYARHPLALLAKRGRVRTFSDLVVPAIPHNLGYVSKHAAERLPQAILRMVDRCRADVVIVSDVFLAYFLARLKISPVLMMHNNETRPGWAESRMTFLSDDDVRAAFQYSRLVAVSRFTAEQLKRDWGVHAFVLPPLIDPETCVAQRRVGRYMGMFTYALSKGAFILQAVARRLRTTRFLATQGWAPEHWQAGLKACPPPKNVTLVPASYDSRTIYAKLGALLLPSLWEDAAPRSVVEAGLNGLPVVAADVGGVGELLGDEGIRIPVKMSLSDAIEKGMTREQFFCSMELHEPVIEGFCRAVRRLSSDRAYYETVAAGCREMAKRHVARRDAAYREFVDRFIAGNSRGGACRLQRLDLRG